jgi:hypothetical protein
MEKTKAKVAILALSMLMLAPLLLSTPSASARTFLGSQVIGTIRVPKTGSYYYVMAERYCDTKSYTEVWARRTPYACSLGDKYLLRIYTISTSAVMNAICQVKYAYDTGKLVGGCLAVGVCVACGFTGCGGGVGCVACIAACNWAVLTGSQDCALGIMQRVTGVPAVAVYPSLSEFGSYLIDQVCKR